MSETMERCSKCDSHALNGRCAMVPSVCGHRTQAIAETEARIAERLKGMVRFGMYENFDGCGMESDKQGPWVWWQDVNTLIQELQPQSATPPEQTSEGIPPLNID